MNLTISVKEAVVTLHNHFDAHKEEYELQLSGWQRSMEVYSKQLSEWAVTGGGDEDRPKEPKKPQKFDDTYKRLLRMLDVHMSETLFIDEDEFDQIFLNRFHWLRTFMSNSVQYGVRTSGEVDEF